jgi:ATP-dependent exoDNAse (exonuclease V) beta subunit
MLNLYRASAGSGKTYRLTRDYIRLLFGDSQPNPHRRILAVTFTNKATEEMKLRIISELDKLAKGEHSDYRPVLKSAFPSLSIEAIDRKAQTILKEILHDYSSFSIVTIDRFFQQVLRSFTREIGLHGGYNIEIDTEEPLSSAIDGLLYSLDKEEDKLLFDWLMNFAQRQIEDEKSWDVKYAVKQLGTEIFKENYKKYSPEVEEKLADRSFLADYQKTLSTIRHSFENRASMLGKDALALMGQQGLVSSDFNGGITRSPMKFFEKLAKKEINEPTGTFINLKDNPDGWSSQKSPQKDAIRLVYNSGLNELVVKTIELFEAPYKEYVTAGAIERNLYALGILTDIDRQIRAESEESNRLMLADTTELLTRIADGSDTPFIFEKTGINIRHLMMDEFQDTSAMQWQNFRPLMNECLAAGEENLIVGDVKQSIYRWRNSDWKLLDEQLFRDIDIHHIHEEFLNDNWRSGRNIIDFNNSFFSAASVLLQELFNGELTESNLHNVNNEPLTHRLPDAYKGLVQHYPPAAPAGHISVHFIDNEDRNWTEEALRKIPPVLEKWQRHGYAPSDIAILTRRKKEATDIVEFLLEYKNSADAQPDIIYDVISNEALIVGNAQTVRFLIAVMRYILHPDDRLQQALVSYLYNLLHEQHTPADAITFGAGSEGEPGLPETIRHLATKYGNRSLFEMNEELISLFRLDTLETENVFLQAFQDMVHQFTVRETAGTASFLEWWDDKGHTQPIAMPETQNAIRVITIHKSKGLGFKAVLMPFADWSLDNTNGDIIWCKPGQAPFDRLSLVPVAYSDKLRSSFFADEYMEEKMSTFIDNLNVAYVAFTRAKNEMEIFAPAPKTNKDGSFRVSSVSSLLYKCIASASSGDTTDSALRRLSEGWNAETSVFEWGECEPQTVVGRTGQQVRYAYTGDSGGKSYLAVKYKASEYIDEEDNKRASSIDRGVLLHDVLRNIRQRGDEFGIAGNMVRMGRIRAEEKGVILDLMAVFWQIPETEAWFDPLAVIMTEHPVYVPGGTTYVPDRIIIKGNMATVVDYKFGQERSSHLRQVRNYMNLIGQMGYETSGFLCYVAESRVKKVN